MCYTDSSVDCSYHSITPSTTHAENYIAGVTALLAALSIVMMLVLFYCLYQCRRKKSLDLVQLDEFNDENDHHVIDHHDIIPNDQLTVSVQPAQEAGSSGDQLQVGLATSTESSQSQCSKPTMEEIIRAKFMSEYQPVPSSSKVVGFHHSNLLGTTVA